MSKQLETIFKQLLLKLLLKFGNSKSGISNSFTAANLSDKKIKFLLIRLNRIGDALITTTLIKLLKNNLNCEIEILADKKNHFIFENNPLVSKTIIFEKGFKSLFTIRNYINKSAFDIIVDVHDDVSTTVSYLIAMAKVPLKFGLEKNNKIIFTSTVERLDGNKYHVIERILELAKLFGIEPNDEKANVQYFPKDSSIQFATEFIKTNFKKKKFLVGINISAGSHSRFWGVDRFKKLLIYLSEMNLNVILIVPPNDFELAEIISESKYPIFSEREFDKAAAIVSKLDLLFTPDTSLVHIASAFEIPVFGLYVKYNTDDVIWYPYKSKYNAVITKEPNFKNLHYEEVSKKFILFFEEVFNKHGKSGRL